MLFLVSLTCCISGTSSASVPLGAARKGTDGHYDMYGCMHSNDYYIVNFSAYQFDPKQFAKTKTLPIAECVDLPKTGKTQIAIDMLDQDVRHKKVALKILKTGGPVLVETPLAVSKQGVISTEVDFKEPGKYQALISVEDNDLKIAQDQTTLQIPLTVALAIESPEAKNSNDYKQTTNGIFKI